MKRNFDLIRTILCDAETVAPGALISALSYPGFEHLIVRAHVLMLFDAGLLDGEMMTTKFPLAAFRIIGLTWEGHDFLDSMRDDETWDKAKRNVLSPAGGAVFSVLSDWLKAEAKARLGLS